jgi:glutamine synthetase
MIYAGLDGIRKKLPLGEAADINLYKADAETLSGFEKLPESYEEACAAASESDFIKTYIPQEILDIYCGK